MDDTPIDPAVFKAQQREQWSNVVQGWRRRWAAFEQGAQPLSDRMMKLAHVAPGQRVLDVATGIGEPAMTAARQVGPSGFVVAIGPNPFALSEPTRLEQVLREAGFAKVYSEPFTVTFEFASVDELLGHLGEVSAPIRMIMATSSPEYQAGFWKKLADAAVLFTDTDGMIRLSNDCLVAAGQCLACYRIRCAEPALLLPSRASAVES